MDYHQQTDALTYDLLAVINRYREEFDLNHQTIIGALEFVKLDLMTDMSVVWFVEGLMEEADEEDAADYNLGFKT